MKVFGRGAGLASAQACAFLLLAFGPRSARAAETATEKRRAQFAAVHRIAIVPAYYGTGRLDQTEPQAAANAKVSEYLDQLRKLQSRTRTLVPERLAARTPFQIVSIEETETALKALDLTPEKMYLNGGRMKGTKFAAPDPAQARRLAERLHADAVVFDELDEPRRSPDHLSFDPLGGLGISEAHVSAKIGFWVLLADGAEVYQRVSDVMHPLTRLGNRQFLFVDWQEANDLAVENFLDELNRYTPDGPATARKPAG